jgi:hypothetical protein
MDAAAAAAMSDPERNPKFRRRWQAAPPCEPERYPPQSLEPGDAVELTGRELLEEWRRERARRKAGAT